MCVCVYPHMCTQCVHIEWCAHADAHVLVHIHTCRHASSVCMYARAPCAPLHDSPLTSYATGRGHSSFHCRREGTYGIDNIAAAGARGCRRQRRGTGRPSLLMSRALALLLSLSSLALFLGFISSIHAYVGSRLWGVVITGPSINLLLHNHFITQFFFKKRNPAKQKTAQFCFLFCFIRELNPHPLLTFSLYPPIRPYLTHHPSALEPLGSIKPWF